MFYTDVGISGWKMCVALELVKLRYNKKENKRIVIFLSQA